MAASTKFTLIKLMSGYPEPVGNKRHAIGNWLGPTIYATGGANLALPTGINFAHFVQFALGKTISGSTYYIAIPFLTNDPKGSATVLVKVFVASTMAEVADQTDLSGVTWRVNIFGIR